MSILELKKAQEVISNLISTIFLNEHDFKVRVLTYYLKEHNSVGAWIPDLYDIDACHAARRYRFSLRNSEDDTLDVYIESDVVFEWIVSINEHNLGEWGIKI